ncbi:outer membrane receptor for ferric coprogen and ferric-rhodotorulic acid [Marinomonas alcarazii]|uniref:Outer membrane receptor for ferric coprogen and ferric-rhodotorulic acid n=1 Tax=Marinomonas alcarazii TaxID=491949 RepID=A0A318VLJ8_9GAMM|nr:TonB-dependent siderophore receptor [Marinomonas alcarazii]PYF84569.1 outer membrane receptor for ferric coprogen and ferric-rhodotorulic acid [Marinomonas alcarazii]
MKRQHQRIFALTVVAAAVSMTARAEGNPQETQTTTSNRSEETVLPMLPVYGEPEETKSATKLDLTVFETPQTVSVVSEDQMNDFDLKEVNSVLKYTPGVTVEKTETDRVYYTARGFDIVNFQQDGVGVPFAFGLNRGADNAAMYEKIEVVKGANGLITGLANPSATVNYVLKRPTDDPQASVSAAAGSWNQRRLEADVSGPLSGDKVKGRLVVTKQQGDSYLDRYEKDLSGIYGILEADFTDRTRASVGLSINDSNNDGVLYGALPLFYSNGSVTNYDRSTSTAPDWAYMDVRKTRTFFELQHDVTDNWQANIHYSHNVEDTEWELLYLAGSPDPETQQGLNGTASYYESKVKEDIVDLYVNGTFEGWGQEHEIVAGVNVSDVSLKGHSVYASSLRNTAVGGDWMKGIARPEFDTYNPSTDSTDIDKKQRSYYVSTRLKASDDLAFLLGARAIKLDQKGVNYSVRQETSETETVPYIGATYEAAVGTMLYASYSKVFNPQVWVDSDFKPLGAAKGVSREVGIKQELNDSGAILTLARFESELNNLGEYASYDSGTNTNIYRGIDIESEGYEVELSGEVSEGLNMSAGYTDLSIKDKDGKDTRTHIPTKQFKLAAAYQLSGIDGLRVGGGLNWQNDIYYNNTKVQGEYMLVDVFASYEPTDHLTLALNLNNITNEKYRESVQNGQSYYGPGRNVMASVTWRY